MVTLPGATQRAALATLFLSLSLAMPLHADAPRVAGRRVVAHCPKHHPRNIQ